MCAILTWTTLSPTCTTSVWGISSNSKTGRMMRKIFYLMAMACMMACQNDDTDFSAYTNGTASNATIPLR